MRATGPAAGTPLTGGEVVLRTPNSLGTCFGLFGVFDPANPLVAGQRRDVKPRRLNGVIGAQRVREICGKLVGNSGWKNGFHVIRILRK